MSGGTGGLPFEASANYKSHSDAWAEVSGYVAEMVKEGSKDAADVLALMHELKPGTVFFTGTVGQLRPADPTT